MEHKPDTSLYLLGKYVGLIFLLPSGAVAGYLIGMVVEHYVHWSAARAFGIVFGVIAALVKLLQELLRDSKRGESGRGS
jgi:MFS family permease